MNKNKIRKPKKNSPSWKILVVFILIIIIIAAVTLVVYTLSYKPQISTNDKLPFETIDPNDVETPNYPKNDDNSDDPEALKPTINDGDYKRNNHDLFTFLIMGKDRVALNTDVIMLVSFDTKKGSVAVMQIPRDTYIELGGDGCKINSVYGNFYMSNYNKVDDPVKTSMEELVVLFEKKFSINIDYYALMQLEGFVNIINILGGIEVDVPFDMSYNDPYQDLKIDIKAGLQTLDGAMSEQFVRFRHSYMEGDVGRVSAQKIFMSAMLKQLKKSVNIFNIAELAGEVINNLTTSMSVNDLIYFAKKGFGVDMSNLTMITMPGTGEYIETNLGRQSFYIIHRADTLYLINKYLNVYDNDISNADFDNKYAFTNESQKKVYDIYMKKATEDVTSLYETADEIDNNGIDITLIN